MKKILFCLLLTTTSMAIAGDKTVKCEIISSGQKYKGDCIFKPQNAGTFTLTNTSLGKPIGSTDINSVTVFISSKDVAQVSAEMGGSISRWGEAKRSQKEKACWIGDDFRVCAW